MINGGNIIMNDNSKQLYLDFEAYERVAEPHKRERASAWRTAILRVILLSTMFVNS